MSNHRLAIAIATLVAIATPTARAIQPAQSGALTALERQLGPLEPAVDELAQENLRASGAVGELIAEAGGHWTVEFELSAGVVRRAFGVGIPLIAGELSGIDGPAPGLEELDAAGRAFIDRYAELFGNPDMSQWQIDVAASQPSADGRLQPIQYARVIDGVPVAFSQIQLVANQGSLSYFNATALGPIDTSSVPSLTVAETWASVTAAAASIQVDLSKAVTTEEPRLSLVPEQLGPGAPFVYHLVRRHQFRLTGGHETWQAGVDAHTGELITFEDVNRYMCALDPAFLQGQVRGGVRPAQATDPEEIRNFIFPLVDDNGTAKNADFNGYFPFSGVTADSQLQGTYFAQNCVNCSCQPNAVADPNGTINFGTGGSDRTCNPAGTSTPADRTAHYHLTAARSMAAKWLTRPWVSANVPSNVNVTGTCNAFWNGVAVNFFPSGGGCANTGEIRDVMQHEWGHGMDQNDGQTPGDSAMGEAYGDHIALFIDHDSCIGQSFFGNSSGPYCVTNPTCASTQTCTGVRNIDEKRTTRGLLTVANVATLCGTGGCSGVLGRECHCEGEIYGQAAFHLAYNLMTGQAYDTGAALPGANPAFSEVASWFIHERLFFGATALMRSYAPSNRQSVGTSSYDAYFMVDDDDANLSNGTPNGAYIHQAFAHHGMQEVTGFSDSANCVPPLDPAITTRALFDPISGNPQVEITWPDRNAAFYMVLRNLNRSDTWLEVRRVTDNNMPYTIYDEPVQLGETYNYVVVAVGTNGCPSPGLDIETIPVALPDVSATLNRIDDVIGGDGDGLAKPGETIMLWIDLRELLSIAPLTNAMVELATTDPLVTVTIPGPHPYGTVPAGGLVAGVMPFEIAIDPTHPCDTNLALVALISGDDACMLRGLNIALPIEACMPAYATTIGTGSDANDPSCSDGDGFPDNGEQVSLDVTVRNRWTRPATNVTVTLSSTNPNVTVTGTNPVVIPSLAPGMSQNVAFTFVANGAGCLEPAELTASVDSDNNVFTATIPIDVVLEKDLGTGILADGFEVDFGNWTAVEFVRSSSRAATPSTWSAYAGPGFNTSCDNSANWAGGCATLTSVEFTPGPTAQLMLDLWYSIEDFGGQWWDRANVHVINVATRVHTPIAPVIGRMYNGGLGDSTALCHIDAQNGWAGSAIGRSWGQAIFDLFPFMGTPIQVEINMNADDAAICEGLYIDNTLILDAQGVPVCDALTCAARPNVSVKTCTSVDECVTTSTSDGVVDPGDQVTYTITLENNGAAPADDVRGMVTVTNGTIVSGGTIGGTPRIDIPPSGTATHTVVVDVTGICGDTLDIDVVNLQAGTTVFPDNLSACDLPIGADEAPSSLLLEDLPATPLAIPENGVPIPFLSRTVAFTVPAPVLGADLSVEVNHGRLADLTARLNGPLGGELAVEGALNASLDITAFVQAEGVGDYILVLADGVTGTQGELIGWSLDLDLDAYLSCNPCNASGCTAPTLGVRAEPSPACVGQAVRFNGQVVTAGSGGFDYEWDFGDGSPVVPVVNPVAPISHAFDGAMPSYNVTFRAVSRVMPSCDAAATTSVTVTPGTNPTGGPIGNLLRMWKAGLDAELVWPGSTVNPPRFLGHKAIDKRELADTLAGIGDEPVFVDTALEAATDLAALLSLQDRVFYEVHPGNSCGGSALP